MSVKVIRVVTFLSLVLIFFSQIYLVYDYFQTTKIGLIRESDAILEEAFKKELDIRSHRLHKIIDKSIVDTIKPPDEIIAADANKVEASYNFDEMNIDKSDVTSLINLAINDYTSKKIPLDLSLVDSIIKTILINREIDSKFVVAVKDVKNDSIIQQSKIIAGHKFLNLQSRMLALDFERNKVLQLCLINPFGLILQRMALMLITSLVFSVICVLAFVYLQRILARQKQLVAFKNEFLGTIAHELKRPVASLVFNLDCLSQSAQVTSGGQNVMLLQNSLRATEEMNDSINMIVNLTKLEEGMLELRHEQIGLMQMFGELKERFTSISPKKLDISISCEPQLKTLWGDRQLLMQCFANLIDNAIKYSGDEVRIQISVRSEGNRMLVSVRDNGFGIPADKLVFLFDKYSRLHTDATKINGFGIGLNYVKNIVEKHRGEVRVESEPGQGSEFCVLLPVA